MRKLDDICREFWHVFLEQNVNFVKNEAKSAKIETDIKIIETVLVKKVENPLYCY